MLPANHSVTGYLLSDFRGVEGSTSNWHSIWYRQLCIKWKISPGWQRIRGHTGRSRVHPAVRLVSHRSTKQILDLHVHRDAVWVRVLHLRQIIVKIRIPEFHYWREFLYRLLTLIANYQTVVACCHWYALPRGRSNATLARRKCSSELPKPIKLRDRYNFV